MKFRQNFADIVENVEIFWNFRIFQQKFLNYLFLKEFCSEVRSAENEYENGNSKKENGYDTKRNILRKIILRK